MAPKLGQIVETILYTSDLSKLAAWYKDVLGLEPFIETLPVVVGFSLPNNTILLLFNRDVITQDRELEGGVIPKHGTVTGLGQHIAFACADANELDEWEKHFQEKGVEVTARMRWEKGGRSVYVKDAEGHVIEIMTRGVWAVY